MSGDPTATYSDQISKTTEVDGLPGDTAPIQLGLADVNGDGLPDRVFTTPSGVFAHYNLGYRFAAAPVKLSTGGFEAQESYAGGLSLGFSTPWEDFSGGAALNWNVDLSRYAWIDVNGDGILDQVHKIDNSHPPTVRFGTGTGMLPPVTYGQMADAQITDQIDAGQQASLDRTDGLGGQFDFTVGIGPLCLVACYLIINPGASYQNSISSTEIDLQDVNGDGYADSLQTLDDNTLTVRENKQADTNLLSTVQNPLGGTMSITYARDGNTVDNPSSVWDMASVEVNDGRPGDGVDVRRTNYTYAGPQGQPHAPRHPRLRHRYRDRDGHRGEPAHAGAGRPCTSTSTTTSSMPGWKPAPWSSTRPTAATSRASGRPGCCAMCATPGPTSAPSTPWPRSAIPWPL